MNRGLWERRPLLAKDLWIPLDDQIRSDGCTNRVLARSILGFYRPLKIVPIAGGDSDAGGVAYSCEREVQAVFLPVLAGLAEVQEERVVRREVHGYLVGAVRTAKE